jgi:integrase
MPRLTRSLPSYRLHKPSGRAVVTLAGRVHDLGPYGSPASRKEYDRLISEWLATGRPAAGGRDLSVTELILAYMEFAAGYYRDADGQPSREIESIREAGRPLKQLYGHTEAAKFGPLALKAVREAMIGAGLCRSTINQRISRVKRLFKWAVENEIVPPSLHHALSAVAGLRAGRSEAPEPRRVEPVAMEHVEAILPFLTAPVRAMVQLQPLTGARSGELTRMRPCDVDRSGETWLYRPSTHKTKHKGKDRVIPLGPKAREVLAP